MDSTELEALIGQECATYGCESNAAVHFIYGGVGSYYCMDCYLRVQRLPKYTPPARRAHYHGHKTLIDGSIVPLTETEATELWRAIEADRERRAEELPTAQDALRALIRAEGRLKELGWWKGGGQRVKRGDDCAVAQTGSTGMWAGRVDEDRKYVFYGDSVSSPDKCWLKPLADLTDDERAHMDECDRREAEAYSAMFTRHPPSGERE